MVLDRFGNEVIVAGTADVASLVILDEIGFI